MHVWDFLPQFTQALKEQLENDEKVWGNTWQHRDIGNQNERIYAKFQDYHDQWENGNNSIPWLKIAGLALIAWIRENHPEIWSE
jgi:hypothetical protein